jgi:hypothetical protein
MSAPEFVSDYLYTRDYDYSYDGVVTYNVKQELVKDQTKFESGWNHELEYLFNDDNSNYAHSSYEPTVNRPVTIAAKLEKQITANRLIFDGSHNSENKYLPKDFKIWVSTNGSDWKLACDVTNSKLSEDGWQVVADFNDMYTFSYYKFEITATHKEYIALRKIILQKVILEIDNGKQITPDNDMFTYNGDWTTESTFATFGHAFVGEKDATVEFEFEGTRLGILSVAGLGTNFKVEIDGVAVSSVELVENTGVGASFISDLLKDGKHTVKITCLDTTNIDSIVIW